MGCWCCPTIHNSMVISMESQGHIGISAITIWLVQLLLWWTGFHQINNICRANWQCLCHVTFERCEPGKWLPVYNNHILITASLYGYKIIQDKTFILQSYCINHGEGKCQRKSLFSIVKIFEHSFDLQYQDISSHIWTRLILDIDEFGDSILEISQDIFL